MSDNDPTTAALMFVGAAVVGGGYILLLAAYGVGKLALAAGEGCLSLAGYDRHTRALAHAGRQIAAIEQQTISTMMDEARRGRT
jgi:hypothetical protein